MKKLILYCKNHRKTVKAVYWLCSLIGLVLVFFALRQNPSFYWLQFAVDQKERVYIGTLNDGVKVYENQEKVGTISFTDRGYSFTIRDGTELIYSSATGVVYVDLRKDFLNNLEKSIIKKEPISATSPHFKLYNKEFTGNGQTYRAKVTPSNLEVYHENGTLLLSVGNKQWNIAIIAAAVFWSISLAIALFFRAQMFRKIWFLDSCQEDNSSDT